MSLDIDGFRILAQLASMANRYADLDQEVARSSRRLLAAIVGGKRATARTLVRFRADFGEETLALVIDGMVTTELRAVLRRVDRFWPDLRTASTDHLRLRIMQLADGDEPMASPGPIPARSAGSQAARVLSPAFAASWDGIDRDS